MNKLNYKITFIIFLYFVILSFSIFAQKEFPSYPLEEIITKITSNQDNCSGGFSFDIYTDTHLNREMIELALKQSENLKSNFIIITGDFTHGGKEDEYIEFIEHTKLTNIPILVVPGNHEYRSDDGITSTEGIKRYKKVFGKDNYYFDYCGWRFIALDVCKYDMVQNNHLRLLEELLPGFEGKSIILAHYPPGTIDGWNYYFKGNVDKLLNLLEKYKVRYYFSGHFHIYDRVKLGDTDIIVAGTTGNGCGSKNEEGYTYHDPEAGSFCNFIHVDVFSNKAEDSVVKFNQH